MVTAEPADESAPLESHPLWALRAVDIAELVNTGKRSAIDVLDYFRQRVVRFNEQLDAFTYLDWTGAQQQAQEVDRRVAAGERLAFAGVPMGVKELDLVAGWPDTQGSYVFRDRIAPRDDAMVERLRAAGAVLIGLTAAPEMGMTAYTHNLARGMTARNPWDLTCSPGGSSGGAAAAVAAGLVPLATGSDGGGSIRLPASLSGLVGAKVSQGRIPRESPRDLWPTTVLGPLATNLADAARFIDVTAGPSGRDRGELPAPDVRYEDMIGADVRSKRFGRLRAAWVDTFGFSRTENAVRDASYEAAMRLVEHADLELVELDIRFDDPVRAWSMLGAPSVIRDFEGVDVDVDALSPEGKWAYRGSPLVTASNFAAALDACDGVLNAIEAAFAEVDVLLLPAAAVSVVPAEGPLPSVIDGEKAGTGATAQFTIPFNLSGHPAISLPAGLADGNHPVGVQIAVGRFREDIMFALAGVYASAFPWRRHAPGWE